MAYAKTTTISEEKSKAEIEQTIRRHVGRDAAFTYGTMPGKAAIQFSAYGREFKFELPLPTRIEAMEKARDKRSLNMPPSHGRLECWLDQEYRSRWRCMLLIIKAKFVAVEMKMELVETESEKASVFEQEFLSRIVGAGGQTLYQAILEAKIGGQRLLPPVREGNG